MCIRDSNSLAGFNHLGTYNGHNYFVSESSNYYWEAARQNAESLSEVYMHIIDTPEEFEFVRGKLLADDYSDSWIGLKNNQTSTKANGWYWIGKDDAGGGNLYNSAAAIELGYNQVTTSSETNDNVPFFFNDFQSPWQDYGNNILFNDSLVFDGII